MGLSLRVPQDDNRETTIERLEENLDRLQGAWPDSEVEVVFRKYDPKRSLDQNALQWVWVRQIAKQLGHPDEEITQHYLLTECYGEHYEEIGNRRIQKYPRTSKFKTEQMAKWLTWLDAYAAANGIALSTPPGYEELAP